MAEKLTAQEQYLKEIEQAKVDFGVTVDSTEELIDMPMFEFVTFCEGKNVGMLLAFRSLLQVHLDRADLIGKKMIESRVTSFSSASERIKLGSVFSVVTKIQDRMGYVDYLVKKNSIK